MSNYKKFTSIILSLMMVSPNISFAFESTTNNYLSYEKELNNSIYMSEDDIDKELNQNVKNISDYNIFIEGTNKVYFNDIEDSTKVIDSWRYNETKTITINANIKNLDANSRYVEVTLPLGMELKMTPESIVDQRTIMSVDTSKFNQTTITTTNSVTHKPKMGTLKYYISDTIESITMDILVSVDAVLWNTINNVSATDSNTNAIKVTVGDKNTQTTKKLDEVQITGRDWSSYRALTFPSSVLNGRDFRISAYATIDFVQNTSNRIYKKVSTSIEIPYYEYIENGVTKKKYAQVKNISVSQSGTYKIENNQILMEWNNVYLSRVDYYVDIETSSLNCQDDTVLNFKNGKICVKEYFTENEHLVYSEGNSTITIISNTKEKFSFGSHAPNVYKSDISNYHNNLTYMGGYRIVNLGADSKPKKIEFQFPKTGIGIKGVRLITPKQAGVYNVNFTLWDKNTGKELSSTIILNKSNGSSDSSGYYLNVTDAIKLSNLNISDPSNYYFKSIDYISQSFVSGYYSYSTGGSSSLYSSGNILGTVLPETPSNTSYPIVYSMYDVESNLSLQDRRTVNVYVTDKGDSTMALTSGSIVNKNGTSINQLNSGDNFYLKSTIEVASYPYRNTTYVSKPVVHLKLPKGFLIDESNTSFESVSYGVKTNLTYVIENKDNPKVASDGSLIYNIKFIDNPGIGYYDENLNGFGYINLYINIRVSTSVKTMSTRIKDILFVSDENISIGGGGSWDKYFVKDTYDINNNGSTTDTIATVSADTALSVISNSNWLEVNWLVSKNNETFKETTQVSLNSNSDSLRFKLNINNINEGITRAGNFYYFVAIPKKDKSYPTEIKDANSPFNFDLELNEKVQTPDGFKALYSTDNQTFNEWSSSINLNDVSMVKVISTKDILQGQTVDIIFNMSYVDKSVLNSGNDVDMSITGYQDYEKNGSSIKYHHTFSKLKIEINIAPKILMSPKDTSVSLNEKTSFITSVDRGAPYATGYWQYKNKGSINWVDTNTTNLEYVINNSTQSLDGCQFRYVLSNKNGTVYSDTITLSVYGYSITIPKNISLDNNGNSTYKISVSGHIPDNSKIDIIPYGEQLDSKIFKLLDVLGFKNPLKVNINQIDTKVNSSDIYFDKTKYISGEVQSEKITAGLWNGTFNFNINCEN